MNRVSGMSYNTGRIEQDVRKVVDDTIKYVGKDIVFGMTLALPHKITSI